MSGGMDLDKLIKTMQPELRRDVYVFSKSNDQELVKSVNALMVFHEVEATTLILTLEAAKMAGIDYEFPCRMITLNVHSSLEAVGFIAKIATHLSKYEMGVNSVAGFYHDHLFIDEKRADMALSILQELAEE